MSTTAKKPLSNSKSSNASKNIITAKNNESYKTPKPWNKINELKEVHDKTPASTTVHNVLEDKENSMLISPIIDHHKKKIFQTKVLDSINESKDRLLLVDTNTITESERISLEEDIQNTVGLVELLHEELEQDKKDRSEEALFYNNKLEELEYAKMCLEIENRQLKLENTKITDFKQALAETLRENENLYTHIQEFNEQCQNEVRLMNDKYNQAVEDLEHINDKLMQEQLKVLKYEEDITEYKENIEELKDALTETLEENEILCKREQELDGCIVDTQTIARAEKLLEYFRNLNIEFPEELKEDLQIIDDMDTTGVDDNEKDKTD